MLSGAWLLIAQSMIFSTIALVFSNFAVVFMA